MRNDDLDTEWWADAPVYWAQGFLTERLRITLEEADRVLRAHADRTGRPLRAVAHAVVSFGLLVDPGDDR